MKRPISEYVPDILAVREDRFEDTRRTGEGAKASNDILSVYEEGGPAYRINGIDHDFPTPCALLFPRGTIDADRQEGRVNGVFALFDGHGLVRRLRGSDTAVAVRLGESRLTVPLLKVLSATDAGRIAARIRAIGEVAGVGMVSRLRRISLLYDALAEYCFVPERDLIGSVHREAVHLRELIQAWAYEQTALEKIYEELELSSAHAVTLFRRAFGITPVAYRRELRLHRARELLVSTRMNVSEAAEAAGYTDPLYFSRIFRQAFGVPPSTLITDYEASRAKAE